VDELGEENLLHEPLCYVWCGERREGRKEGREGGWQVQRADACLSPTPRGYDAVLATSP